MARGGASQAPDGAASPLVSSNFEKKRKFLKNTSCDSLESDIIEALKTTKPNLITEIKMDISKAHEILKTIEKRGPFFAFDEIDQNAKARALFFELQDIDNKIGKNCVMFINAKTYSERSNAWRGLLTHFDEFRVTLSALNFELEDDDAHALIGQIWGDCCDCYFEVKRLKQDNKKCLSLRNLSNISWLLIRCCQDDVLKYYQDNLEKAWQDVLKDNE